MLCYKYAYHSSKINKKKKKVGGGGGGGSYITSEAETLDIGIRKLAASCRKLTNSISTNDNQRI